jgi:acid phosphatase
MHHAVFTTLSAVVLTSTAFMLFYLLPHDIDMAFSRNYVSLLFASIATVTVAQNVSKIDLGWYAPKRSWVNDLGQVLNGTGTNGFVFNSSQLPVDVEYGTYNWCNMPHVRKQEYVKIDDDFELVYVEV